MMKPFMITISCLGLLTLAGCNATPDTTMTTKDNSSMEVNSNQTIANQENANTNDAQSNPLAISSTNPQSLLYDIKKQDDTWSLLTNKAFGYQLQIPNKSLVSMGNSMEDVTVIANNNASLLWVVRRSEEQTLPQGATPYDQAMGHPWALLAERGGRDESKEDFLTRFIQKRYGSDCSLDSITPTKNSTTYDARVMGSGPEGNCFMNYIYHIKYNSLTHTAVAWDIGQDTSFPDALGNGYDQDMAQSFHFTE